MRYSASWTLLAGLLFLSGSVMILAAAPADAPTEGYRAEFISTIDGLGKKFVSLAEAMPQDHYTWRPEEGVRSVSEVYLHMAQANYGIPNMLGVKPPASFNPKGFEKSTTDKAKIVQELKDSFAHLRAAGLSLSDADENKKIKAFGGAEMTQRAFLAFIEEHMGEHLGQSIAYARVAHVTPSWTEEAMRRQQQAKKSGQ